MSCHTAHKICFLYPSFFRSFFELHTILALHTFICYHHGTAPQETHKKNIIISMAPWCIFVFHWSHGLLENWCLPARCGPPRCHPPQCCPPRCCPAPWGRPAPCPWMADYDGEEEDHDDEVEFNHAQDKAFLIKVSVKMLFNCDHCNFTLQTKAAMVKQHT